MRRLSPNSFRNQRGAIGLFGVLTLLLAVLFTALAVDSGRLWMQQRKLQSIADIAAIQASRQLGCSASLNDVMAAAQAAAANNGFAGQLSQGPNLVDLGSVTTSAGIREFTSGASAEAVFVRATQEVPSSLVAGGLFGGTITLTAEAVSVSDPSLAAFSAGSFLVSLDSEDSALLNALLGGMLGSSLNLDVLSYRGIAATRITLQDMLAVSGGIGTVDDLLDADMQIGDLLELFANAAGQNGAADIQAIAGMQTIAGATVDNASLTLGELLAVTTPDTNAAATVGLNALSLITAAAMIANGQNAVTLNALLPGVNVGLTVIEPPQMAIGPPAGADGTACTTAKTAQIRVLAGVNLLGIDILLKMEVAQGEASLLQIDANDDSTQVTIGAQPGIASIALRNQSDTGPAEINLLGLKVATLGLNLPLQNPSGAELDFDVAHPVANDLPQTQSVSSSVGGSLANALSQQSTIEVKLLPLVPLVGAVISPLLNNLLNGLLPLLGTTLGNIAGAILDPLLNLLGIELGGLDITLEDLQYRQAKPLVI
ncbi:hypothetical protein MTYP_01686 [Methylophilaceae bacterium]|nr:hypothetical protein MTYP_01686 [Methylophilaceae bacterium]